MNRKTQSFFGAFCITVILIGALCGFVAVDLSTDKYMPDQFGPFFVVESITEDGAAFSYMAGYYTLDFAPVKNVLQILSKYRGLLPAIPRAAASLAAQGMEEAINRMQGR